MDKDGRTPLSWAVGYTGGFGHYERDPIVRMFLEREDVNPDSVDKNGRTLHSWAVEHKHTTTAEMLLPRSRIIQDIVAKDPTSRTAVKRASKGVVRQRLGDRGFIPQSAGSNSSTTLFPAKSSESSQHRSKIIRRS